MQLLDGANAHNQLVVDAVHVEGRHHCAAAPDDVRRAPDPVRHPAIAQDRNAGLGQIANRLLQILDLLVATGQAEVNFVEEVLRHILQRFQAQAKRFDPLAHPLEVAHFPDAAFVRQHRRIELHAGDAKLFGKGETFGGEFAELA